jgi:hypothetical protein
MCASRCVVLCDGLIVNIKFCSRTIDQMLGDLFWGNGFISR